MLKGLLLFWVRSRKVDLISNGLNKAFETGMHPVSPWSKRPLEYCALLTRFVPAVLRLKSRFERSQGTIEELHFRSVSCRLWHAEKFLGD